MRPNRSLALKREVLSPLTTDELSAVAGGTTSVACDTVFCVSTYPSYGVPTVCASLPLDDCLSLDGCAGTAP